MLGFAELAQAERADTPAVVVTVAASAGSTPRKVGARMLVHAAGGIAGTVGGGALEKRAVELALQRLHAAEADTVVLDLGKDLGMACGGRVTLLFEPMGNRPALLLFGAGHVGLHTARLAQQVGFRVVVFDGRADYLTLERFPDPMERVASFEVAHGPATGPQTWAVVVTYGHAVDTQVAKELLARDLRFVGVIGSQRKAAELRQQCLAAGLPAHRVARMQVPVGLDIAAETPEEIALSIVAELVRLRRQTPTGVAALVAAAGDSQRMGRPKALLKLDGEALVHRLARVLLAAGARPCIVTIPEGPAGLAVRAAVSDLDVECLPNGWPASGLIGSVRTALDVVAAHAAALAVAPVDCPFVDEALARGLFAAAADGQHLAVPRAGEREGHPVVFGRRFFAELRASGCDQGAAALLAKARAAVVGIAASDERLFTDVNTPEAARALGLEGA